jgi:hypothetical protein
MSKNCCHKFVSDSDGSKHKMSSQANPVKRTSHMRRLLHTVKCGIPGAVLVLLPKCPVCMAAWISVATGFGISVSAAGYLRMSLIVLCIISLCYFVITRMRRTSD